MTAEVAGARPEGEIGALAGWLAGPADAARVDRTGRTGARRHRGGPAAPGAYTVVPSARAPRLLVPAGARRHATAAVQAAAGSGPSWRAVWRRRGLAACFATGLGDQVFRDRLVVGPADSGAPADSGDPAEEAEEADGLAAHLAEVLGTRVRLGLRLGPPRANRKPVLVLLDPAARVVGFAKLGVDPATCALLATERAALAAWAAHPPDAAGGTARGPAGAAPHTAPLTAPLEVPAVQHFGPWRDGVLLVTTPVAAGPGRSRTRRHRTWRPRIRRRQQARLLTRAADAIARAQDTVRGPVADSGYLAALAGRVAALPDDRHRRLLTRVCEAAADVPDALEYGHWHGDWYAGNRALCGDRVAVWDWERAAAGVPVGFDPMHDAFMTMLLARARPVPQAAARAAARAAAATAPLGVPPHAAPLVAALYFAEIATRYRSEANDAAGHALPRPARWLPAALAALGPPWSALPDDGAPLTNPARADSAPPAHGASRGPGRAR